MLDSVVGNHSFMPFKTEVVGPRNGCVNLGRSSIWLFGIAAMHAYPVYASVRADIKWAVPYLMFSPEAFTIHQ